MSMSYRDAWNAKPDGRSREEIFQSLVDRIKKDSGETLSDVEAHAATRNVIAFVRELIGLKQDETVGHLDLIIKHAISDDEHE